MLVFKTSQSWIFLIVFLAMLLLALIQTFYNFGLIGFFWSLIFNDSFERFYQNPVNLSRRYFIDFFGWVIIVLLLGLIVGAHFKAKSLKSEKTFFLMKDKGG